MIKVLFILSAVLMAVATFFAYQNNRTLAALRAEKAATHQTIKGELANVQGTVEVINGLIADVQRVQQEVDVESEKLKGQRLKIAQAENETKRTQDEIDTNNAALASMREELDQLPPDVKPETLVEDLNRIKQTIAELQANADLKQQEVDAEMQKAGALQRVVDNNVRKIEERKEAFERNSMSARIVAVNSDWGFVIVDAGEPQGITAATKLLVTRGTQTVGKLNILAVEGSRTIANILEETVTPGMSIAPGDEVILENLYQ